MSKEPALKIPSYSNKQKFMSDFLRNTEQYISELPRINQNSESNETATLEKSPRFIEQADCNQGPQNIKLPYINKLKNLERELELRKKKLDSIDESRKKRDLTKISREYVEYLEFKKKLQKGEVEESYYEFDNYRNYKYVKVPSMDMDLNRKYRNHMNKSLVSEKKITQNNSSARVSADPGPKNLIYQHGPEPNLNTSIISKKLQSKRDIEKNDELGVSILNHTDMEDEPISARRKGTKKRVMPNNSELRAIQESSNKILSQGVEDERDVLHKRLIMMIEKAQKGKFDSDVNLNSVDKPLLRDKLVTIKKNYKIFNNDGIIDKGDDVYNIIEKNNLKISQIIQKSKHFSLNYQRKKKKGNKAVGKAKSLLQEYMDMCTQAMKFKIEDSSLSIVLETKDLNTSRANNSIAEDKVFYLPMLKANFEIFKSNKQEINDRILLAFGLNPLSDRTKVGWESFSAFKKIIINRDGTLYENVGFVTKFFNPDDKKSLDLSDFVTVLREICIKIDSKNPDPNPNKSNILDLLLDNLFYAGVIKRDSNQILTEDFRQCLISRNVSHHDLLDLIIENFD